jgi:hypothetical protein
MIQLANIFGLGTVASIAVLLVAPPGVVYLAAFIAMVPVLGMTVWLALGAIYEKGGVRRLSSAVLSLTKAGWTKRIQGDSSPSSDAVASLPPRPMPKRAQTRPGQQSV